jgi:hypothetical protein
LTRPQVQNVVEMVFQVRSLQSLPAASLLEIVERHLLLLGIGHDANAPSNNGRCYSSADGSRAARVYIEDVSTWVWLEQHVVEPLLPDRIADALCALSVDLGADLARTDCEYARAAIHDDELSTAGRVRTLHWFQYFSGPIAGRWPSNVFDGLPDCRVIRMPGGAVAIRFDGSPYGRFVRRFAAAALGIDLPHAMGRNPATGEPIRIPCL